MYESIKEYIRDNFNEHSKKSRLAATIFYFFPGSFVSVAKDKVKKGEMKKEIKIPSESELEKMSREGIHALFAELAYGRTLQMVKEKEFARCNLYALLLGGVILYYLLK